MIDYSRLEGKKILITGASGLIGRAIVSSLLTHKGQAPIHVIALVRDEKKARKIFSDLPQEYLSYLVCDITKLEAQNLNIEYIIHGANQTESKKFVDEPVEVILGTINGTKNILDFANANPIRSFVYLSTMEVYGTPLTDDKITEKSPAYLDTMCARSSYPESKRVSECLCASYFAEYGLPTKVIRLTQTFGEGVQYNDPRIFAEIARCIIEEKDITLNTKGESKRNYLYIEDAVNAILTVLLYGNNGEAYNAANEKTYCSILEMAQLVSNNFGNGKTGVCIKNTENIAQFGYAPTLKMNLDSAKLRKLGWSPSTNLAQAYKYMIQYMKSLKEKDNSNIDG